MKYNDEGKINVFELYKHIIRDTEPLSDKDIDLSYDSLDMNKFMSFDPNNVFYASEISRYPFIPKHANYLYYFFLVKKKQKCHFLHLKKDRNEEDEEIKKKAVYFLPDYSRKMISDVLPLIKDEMMKIKTIEGGVCEK